MAGGDHLPARTRTRNNATYEKLDENPCR